MSDNQDYIGYHCRHCDQPLFGQRRKWCNLDCNKMGIKMGIKPPSTQCAACGQNLPPGRSKWCSDQCNPKKAKKHGTMEQFHKFVRQNARHKFNCLHCGQEAVRNPSGTNRQKGFVNQYCTQSCRMERTAKVNSEIDALNRIRRANKPKPPPKVKPEVIKKKRICPCCSVAVLENGCRKCKPCAVEAVRLAAKVFRQTEKGKSKRRAEKLKRKALERGAKVGETFDPFEIFQRDGWRCQMCGTKTPISRRGSNHPNAPELDHILPLSKGGKHTMENTQCACRSCNGRKGASLVPYQAGLFTSLWL